MQLYTVQLNLNLTERVCGMGLNTRCILFHTCESIRVHARLMTSNLSFIADAHVATCQECRCQIWIACILVYMQIVRQGQQ